ncbi:hypothetical protein SynBIOSE41_02193 [Synechococcus sp. BIOS-E4-1]|nr:hypothetical protein SynBIOSE41_02193 [Synechococcus sp. BIOS-E4-1]
MLPYAGYEEGTPPVQLELNLCDGLSQPQSTEHGCEEVS